MEKREIRFRAWDTFNSKIIDWELVKDCFRGLDWDTVVSDYLLMQYTGLKDKNGKEIYEGDIVKHDDFSGGACLRQPQRDSVVGWSSKNACFHLEGYQAYGMDKKFEVIGNIYSNPELLKG